MANDIRDAWQSSAENAWNSNGGNGTVVASTGTGKTYLGIRIAIKYIEYFPNAIIHIIVPTAYLKKQWRKDFITSKNEDALKNVQIFVINTYARTRVKCSLRIFDEFHRAGGPSFQKIITFPCDHFLGLTATLKRKDGLHLLLEKSAPVVYNLPLKEARRLGFVSDYQIYNLGVDFDEETKIVYQNAQSMFNTLFAAFEHDFDGAMACMKGDHGELQRFSHVMKIPTDQVRGKAMGWMYHMKNRKEILHKAPAKLPQINKILHAIGGKTLIFSQTTDFCDAISEYVPNCESYHSNIKTQLIDGKKIGPKKFKESMIDRFENGDLDRISCAKALEEGFSVNAVTTVIIASYNSDVRGFIQKMGRAVRFVPGKKANIICLYMKPFELNGKKISSKEVGWLKASQVGNGGSVKWVNSINEIVQQETLSF